MASPSDLRSGPRWPSFTSRSPQPRSPHSMQSLKSSSPDSPLMQSPKTVMQDLVDKGKASAQNTPTSPPQGQQPTLQDLISQSNTTTQLGNRVITNPKNRHHYKTKNIIGSSSGGSATVYNGVYCVNDSNELLGMEHYDIYVAVKVIDMAENQEEYDKLVDQINRSRQLDHPNLLRVKEDMVVEDTFYVMFLLMDGSLRCLLKSVFTHGIPENLVAIVLKEVLEALANLHQQGHLHKELNAGHIYYKLGIPAIKIGFMATIYEHNLGDDGQALPVREICEWAAAPEIYHLDEDYTEKSDVWLVGITALELVFGGIQVKNRQGLEILIAEATGRKGKGKEKVEAVGKYIKKMIKKMKIGKSGSSSKRDEVTLSRGFKKMLALCLAEDAGQRPTAAALMQHNFFKICDGVSDVYDFRNAVEVARRERRMLAGPSSGSNVAGPSSASNVAGPSSASNVAAPSSGSNVAAPSTGSNVAAPSPGSNVAGPSSASNVAGPSSESNVAAPSSGSNVASPSTGSNVAGPSSGSKLVNQQEAM